MARSTREDKTVEPLILFTITPQWRSQDFEKGGAEREESGRKILPEATPPNYDILVHHVTTKTGNKRLVG